VQQILRLKAAEGILLYAYLYSQNAPTMSINHGQLLASNKGYLVVITTDSPVKITPRQLEVMLWRGDKGVEELHP
jgi:hypothetical protein